MGDIDRIVYWQKRASAVESELAWAKRDAENTERWARDVIAREHRLSDRCTYLYGLAAKHGATDDELSAVFTEPAALDTLERPE
jgi:hypothetical protein